MLFKRTQGLFIALVLTCCGCQELQSDGASASSDLNRQHKGSPAAPTVMVYYFHRTTRCFSCLSIEANAAQVIKDNFRQQMTDGRLMWMPFNLDDPGGEEFRRDFDITTSTLVVAKVDDGNQLRYKKLTKVWELLSDPQALSEYVENEINEYLNR